MASFSSLLDGFFYRPDEDPGPLLEQSTPPADAAAATPDEPSDEFLAFWLEHECYALPIAEVREVVRVPPLTELPRGPKNLLGVMNLRGEVLPVYDLKMRLHLSDAPPRIAGPDAALDLLPRGSRVLVLRSEPGDAGVLVDRVGDVFRLRQSKIEAPPHGVGERDGVIGIGRKKDQLYILLDAQRALE